MQWPSNYFWAQSEISREIARRIISETDIVSRRASAPSCSFISSVRCNAVRARIADAESDPVADYHWCKRNQEGHQQVQGEFTMSGRMKPYRIDARRIKQKNWQDQRDFVENIRIAR